ncbi:unnamed protein product [Cuscuta europaea]|uniref:Alkaline/neutral invertase n=1 Tax=Cuscuta europaea TaxID=41803 RepID=A0A9P0ZNC0_CUSEU|nr:unnamed protein product [Cuscuta europaea]
MVAWSCCSGISGMEPSYSKFVSYSSSILGYPFERCNRQVVVSFSKPQPKLGKLHTMGGGKCNHRADTITRLIYLNRCAFCGSDSNVDQPGFFSGIWLGRRNMSLPVVPMVASDMRSHLTTSVEAQVSEKSFYIQGGMNLQPLLIVKKETQEDGKNVGINDDESTVNNNDVNESSILKLTHESVSEVEQEAWKLLKGAVVNYCGYPVGTVAANDPAGKLPPLNYDQVFIRDFVPSALAFLLNGEGDIVKNFLLHTLQLQSWEKTVDFYSPGHGLMPASFKVRSTPVVGKDSEFVDGLDPELDECAIGRVAPVDSGLWWIILLRAYVKITGDYSLQERVDVQTGIKLMLNFCLRDGFNMFPTLLVTDGSCMVDRRMGIHGHPLEIQPMVISQWGVLANPSLAVDPSLH